MQGFLAVVERPAGSRCCFWAAAFGLLLIVVALACVLLCELMAMAAMLDQRSWNGNLGERLRKARGAQADDQERRVRLNFSGVPRGPASVRSDARKGAFSLLFRVPVPRFFLIQLKDNLS